MKREGKDHRYSQTFYQSEVWICFISFLFFFGGGDMIRILSLRGSILQDRTCKNLSLAENPTRSPSVAKWPIDDAQVNECLMIKIMKRYMHN